MKKKTIAPIWLAFVICCATFFGTVAASGEDKTASGWHAPNLPFRVLNTTSISPSLWVCGTDESVAASSDGGEHWQVKHKTADGGVLLNIGFASEKFGYAAGTGGLLLITEDGGETWAPHAAGKDAILQVSFSDAKHGLVRTPGSLLFTTDDGETWAVVSAGQNADQMKRFRYTFSLVALDPAHMAVMMKDGSAQYNGQGFLVTGDSGKSWKFVDIPSTTLYSFLRVQGKYWTVGTEVIHKDQPGGGYAVPVALSSSDGEKWEHAGNDLSACKSNMCVGCTTAGCLSANGSMIDLFSGQTSYKEFLSNVALTSKWAAAGSAVCFVGNGLQCADLKPAAKPGSGDGPSPVAVGPGPLGAPPAQEPRCIICSLDRVFIDKKAQGPHTIQLALEIARNGTVTNAVAKGSPTPEIKSQVEQQAHEWIFEPYSKDGVGVGVRLNTSVLVNVIRPQ